jgi:MFS superfamily sulfate permease-like transporter
MTQQSGPTWLRRVPAVRWLAGYRAEWLPHDAVAGATLAAYLPKAVLAAVVLTAVYGLIDFPAMLRMWRISRMDFYAAAIALGAVLLLGILQGILLAALAPS